MYKRKEKYMKKTTYSEIWDILQQIEEREKIPKEILENIDNRRDKKYKSNINLDIPLENQNISEEATNILCYLNLKYWSTPEENNELKQLYKKNENEFIESVDIDKILEQRRKAKATNILPDIVNEKEKWYISIINKIAIFLKKIRR